MLGKVLYRTATEECAINNDIDTKNNIMEKQFVPYEQALDLKELGFDEPCFGYFQENKIKVIIDNSGLITNSNFSKIFSEDRFRLVTPLYQQAFRWFRDKHSLQHEIVYDMSNDLTHNVYVYTVFGTDRSEEYKTYEEAELDCLKKLIEIVKNK